jgi:Family of unknown function (DUF6209)
MSATKGAPVAIDNGAVLSFQTGWRQNLVGFIRQGELLSIHYDPERLTSCRGSYNGGPSWDLSATVRFSPSGEISSGGLIERGRAGASPDSPRPVPFTVRIPADATQAELWFQNTNIFGCSVFDSQFGNNYRFVVDRAGPAQPVMYRDGAGRSPEMVNVFTEKIAKVKHSFGSNPAAGSELETHFDLTVWVSNVAFEKNVWVDFHVFDQDDNRVNADTLTLSYSGPAGGNGDFFRLNQLVFRGSGGVPGNVWPRPDVRRLQYRVYYQVNGRLFTDGALHQIAVPADAQVSQKNAATAAA